MRGYHRAFQFSLVGIEPIDRTNCPKCYLFRIFTGHQRVDEKNFSIHIYQQRQDVSYILRTSDTRIRGSSEFREVIVMECLHLSKLSLGSEKIGILHCCWQQYIFIFLLQPSPLPTLHQCYTDYSSLKL